MTTLGLQEDLQQAYLTRSDYLAAAAQLRAAEHSHRAAKANICPTCQSPPITVTWELLRTIDGTFEAAANLNVSDISRQESRRCFAG